MNSLRDPNLPRMLMLPPAEDLSFYRKGDTLQQALYHFVLDEKYSSRSFRGDALWALNEAYYQCARLYDDPSPESDIFGNYLFSVEPIGDGHGTKGVSEKGYFVFCLVYVALSVQASLPESVNIFRSYLRPLLEGIPYYEKAEAYIQRILSDNAPLCSDLAPRPYPLISYYSKDIEAVTNGFDLKTIIRILRRFRTKDYQHVFLNMVEKSFYQLNPKANPSSAKPDDIPF